MDIDNHNIMANQYIPKFKTAILDFNSNVPDSVSNALAWSGLQNTNVWNRNPDTSQILRILNDAALGNATLWQNFPPKTLNKCP